MASTSRLRKGWSFKNGCRVSHSIECDPSHATRNEEHRREEREEGVPEIRVSATAACLSPCILLLGPGLKLGITKVAASDTHTDRLPFKLINRPGKKDHVQSKIEGLPGRIHLKCRWMTWICGDAELGDETIWRWMRNEWWTIVVIYMLTSGWTGRGDMAVPSRHKNSLFPREEGLTCCGNRRSRNFMRFPPLRHRI